MTPIEAAVAGLSPQRMKDDVDFLADDAQGGRNPGSVGSLAAREHIRDAMVAMGLEPFGQEGTFYYEYDADPDEGSWQLEEDGSVVANTRAGGVNVVGLLRGTDAELANEYLVYVAHYDHLGVTKDGDPFNGAHDDAGGVAVGLEVARALAGSQAARKRSIVFLISDGEERGLEGAEMWLAAPPVPAEQIVLAISGDPLGRRLLPDYSVIGLSGAEHSSGFLEFLRGTADFVESDVVFINRAFILLFASDQDEFHAMGIPAVWVLNMGLTWYHTVDDDAETIDYRMLLEDARWLSKTLAAAADSSERFAYEGPKALDVQSARDIRALGQGVLGSAVLTQAERAKAEQLLAQLDAVIDAEDWSVVGSRDAFLADALSFLVLSLTGAHPGEVPPPFP